MHCSALYEAHARLSLNTKQLHDGDKINFRGQSQDEVIFFKQLLYKYYILHKSVI